MKHEDFLLFLEEKPGSLALYQQLEKAVLGLGDPVQIRVGKSQVSFVNRHIFACASLMRVRKKQDLPDPYLVVTFGLDRQVSSPRIAVSVEPYPNRWTHHVLIQSSQEIDEELLGWLREAYVFSAQKRRRL